MGLAVEVGMLSDLIQNDPEGADWLRDSFSSVNAVLAENKLPPHREPESLPALNSRAAILSYPYSFLHHLRRVAAHAAEKPGWVAKPFPDADDPLADPVVDKQSANLKSHLLCHSDCEGFYLPIEFDEPIGDDHGRIPGDLLGSSIVLIKELVAAAPALGIRLENGHLSDRETDSLNAEIEAESALWIEKAVWLSLFEAARLSIEHKTAVCFA